MGIRAIIALVVLAIIAGAGAYVSHLKGKADKYTAERARRESVEDRFAQYIRQDDEQDAKRDKASQGYQDEIARLNAENAARPVPVVRVCKPNPIAPMPARTETPGGPSTAATAPGVVSAGTGTDTQGRDIGPALARLLDRADLLSAQTRAILTLTGE